MLIDTLNAQFSTHVSIRSADLRLEGKFLQLFLDYSISHDVFDEDTAKATALQCRLAVTLTLHDCSLDAKCN